MTSDAKIKQSGFKIEKVDLTKPAVLEASAGTGKTYSLTGLVIRLLIGHKCLPLDLEHILLVTFTEVATADLRRKVLEKIISVRETFELSMLIESADLQSISSVDPFALILLRELFDSKNGKFTDSFSEIINDINASLNQATESYTQQASSIGSAIN
ncbi:MAG: UvrD-helicase domain-containing protein, partial [Succinivibrionaceae bacterium]|nr:UvrD-helicase domain-containing protein [Succinivibrionaceae bacterium]